MQENFCRDYAWSAGSWSEATSSMYVVCESEVSVMSMMHMPWVLVALVVFFALIIVGLFIAGRVFSSRKSDRDYPGPSQGRE